MDVDKDIHFFQTGRSVLSSAAAVGAMESVTLLLDRGANVHDPDNVRDRRRRCSCICRMSVTQRSLDGFTSILVVVVDGADGAALGSRSKLYRCCGTASRPWGCPQPSR